MSKTFVISLLAVLASAVGWSAAVPSPIVQDRGECEWKTSGSMPPGTEYCLLYEDPKTHAVELLARFKARLRVPSHHHTNGETLVIVRGKLGIDFGSGERVLGPGSFVRVPAGMPHSTRAAGMGALEMLVVMTGSYDVLGLEHKKAE
ncbi:MAG: cupin domain-containing protein [Elusimicrobia bacterium]|nr:cupin domain-containing protein [Elusimicrobiota bacterium]